ncbi:MAG: hypothetical protein HYT19_01095 [Candidatus Nealsonbacteria bacterium]|nr:hypothetical protein [Candidatus Nealsonbacteria bacterium]
MKKLLIGLALLTIVAAPLSASAIVDAPQECCKLRKTIILDGVTFDKAAIVGETLGAVCSVGTIDAATANWGMVCLINTLNGIIDWTFTVLIILAVFMTILGAWTIVTAGGKAESVSTGKNFILFAAIGLAVAFLAKALPGVVKSIAGF